MDDCIIEPAGITAAARWHRALPDGRFGYDTAFDFLGPVLFASAPARNPHFPVALDAALGASPEQYARFLRALLAGTLFNPRPLRSHAIRLCPSCDERAGKAALMAFLSRDDASGALAARGRVWGAHGLQPNRARHPLVTTVAETPYARGSWLAHPEGAVHSLGAFGTCPWVDVSSADPRQHHYGLIVGNSLDLFNFYCFLPALGVLLALMVARVSRRSATGVPVWFCDGDSLAAAAGAVGISTCGFPAFLVNEWPAALAIVFGAAAGQCVSSPTAANARCARARNDGSALQTAFKLAPLGMLLTAVARLDGPADLSLWSLAVLGSLSAAIAVRHAASDRTTGNNTRTGPNDGPCATSTSARSRKRQKAEASSVAA
jgi:hypothetical protein